MKKGISFLRNVVRLLIWILAVLGWLALLTSSPLMALVLVALLCSCLAGRKSSWAHVVTRVVLWGLAILGGLIVILSPLIPGALVNANALRIGGNGMSIVVAILSVNLERESMGKSNVWPSVSSDFSGTLKDYTKAPDAETYFADLIDSECVVNLSWQIFAGAGVTAVSNRTAFIQGDHNVWNVVAGLDESAPDNTPFLFTRNLNITMEDLRDENVDLRSRLARRINPFGRNLVVVIRKGGAMDILKARQLTRESFVGDAVFNAATNRHATILKAKSMP